MNLEKVLSAVTATAIGVASAWLAYRVCAGRRSRKIRTKSGIRGLVENIPLKNRRIWYTKVPVNRKRILQAREAFWSQPKTVGDSWTWNLLKKLCGIYNVEKVQKELDEAELILSSGFLEDAYDLYGQHYIIPIYCISFPKNLLLIPDTDENEAMALQDANDIAERGSPVDIYLRIHDGNEDVKWRGYAFMTIAELKRDVEMELGMARENQRWFTCGHELRNSLTLERGEVEVNQIIHILPVV